MKLIELILDKYFTKKLGNKILSELSIFNLDKKIKYKDKIISVYVKRREYNDKFYKLVYCSYYNESINCLINFKELISDIKYIIKIYIG